MPNPVRKGDRNTYTVLTLEDENTDTWRERVLLARVHIRNRFGHTEEERQVLQMLGLEKVED